MQVSIITFAGLGKKRNLKTPDIAPVITVLRERNELSQVICHSEASSGILEAQVAVPWLLKVALRLYEKVTRITLSRRIMEKIFDWHASRLLRQADVALFHGGYFLPLTARVARSQGAKTVDIAVSAHPATNALLEQEERKRLNLSGPGWYTSLVGQTRHIGRFDYLIAISDFVRESYVQAGFNRDNIYVAHPDIDLTRFPVRTNTPTTFTVVYAAYTAELKGLHYLLDAWNMLALSNARLILIGGYGVVSEHLKEYYDARIAADASIIWSEHSATPEEFYQEASLMAFPSLTEGFGRVTLEAMACGIPVITTENARGIVEDGKTGFVVPIRDADALVKKIRYLYDHQDIAREMGQEARRAVEAKRPFGEAVYEICRDIMKREGKL